MKLRLSIAQLDYDILDSWDFDVFYYMPEQLIAYVALMFISLGLTTQDVRIEASCLVGSSVHASPLCLPHSLREVPAAETYPCHTLPHASWLTFSTERKCLVMHSLPAAFKICLSEQSAWLRMLKI